MSLHDKLRSFQNDKIAAEKGAGIAFMNENKSKPGVTTLPNGIQYEVIKEGTGDKPYAKSTIKAHYRGSLLNGKEFDSSYRRNQPFTAPLTSLIRGWQEVIPLMPVGSIWKFWIPSDLAYGDRGTGGIPGGATLVLEIELLEIIK